MGLNKILLGLLIFLFIGFCISLALLIRENSQCSQNPFVFGARRVVEEGSGLMCRCDLFNSKFASFEFNNEGVYPIFIGLKNDGEKDINFSSEQFKNIYTNQIG